MGGTFKSPESAGDSTRSTMGGGGTTAELFAHFRHRKADARVEGVVSEVPFPPPPESFEDLGVGFDLVLKLILKHLYLGGELRIDALAELLAIPISLLERPIRFLRKEALIEARGGGSSGISGLMLFSLGDRGRQRAMAYIDENSYCGAVPLTLEAYCRQVEVQSVKAQIIDQHRMGEVFGGIVVRDKTLSEMGAAFNSGRSLFMYGPAGVGKTFLASQMVKALYGDVFIPRAVVVEGQVVRVFDPANHVPVPVPDAQSAEKQTLHAVRTDYDQRWVRCRRPVIFAGGELTLSMLDLQYQPDTRFYEAPLQMKANGGIFMIDDLGRQQVDTTQLLNRWIVPLENGIDYLSMHTGNKFQIPFDLIPVFATNLQPRDLADDAFLRRLGYKIRIDYLTEDEYRTVFAQYCVANNLAYDDAYVDYLLQKHYRPTGTPLIACHPRDLIGQVIDYNLYEGRQQALSEELLSRAWDTYFVAD